MPDFDTDDAFEEELHAEVLRLWPLVWEQAQKGISMKELGTADLPDEVVDRPAIVACAVTGKTDDLPSRWGKQGLWMHVGAHDNEDLTEDERKYAAALFLVGAARCLKGWD